MIMLLPKDMAAHLATLRASKAAANVKAVALIDFLAGQVAQMENRCTAGDAVVADLREQLKVEQRTHDVMATQLRESQAALTVSGGVLPPTPVPAPPPITPAIAFDIMSERQGCIAAAANAWQQLDSDKWDKMSRSDVGYWMRGLIVQLISARPVPVIGSRA